MRTRFAGTPASFNAYELNLVTAATGNRAATRARSRSVETSPDFIHEVVLWGHRRWWGVATARGAARVRR
ncbi:hypothetical protein [Saccharopolyspora pogona]|uniref:hypothetical protein n=1 Tax=Saccharopolyspora pogona TaxID=333966 RepID=UPI001682361A|nr:hypothetical protein [Saccharopolyspora pogona]